MKKTNMPKALALALAATIFMTACGGSDSPADSSGSSEASKTSGSEASDASQSSRESEEDARWKELEEMGKKYVFREYNADREQDVTYTTLATPYYGAENDTWRLDVSFASEDATPVENTAKIHTLCYRMKEMEGFAELLKEGPVIGRQYFIEPDVWTNVMGNMMLRYEVFYQPDAETDYIDEVLEVQWQASNSYVYDDGSGQYLKGPWANSEEYVSYTKTLLAEDETNGATGITAGSDSTVVRIENSDNGTYETEFVTFNGDMGYIYRFENGSNGPFLSIERVMMVDGVKFQMTLMEVPMELEEIAIDLVKNMTVEPSVVISAEEKSDPAQNRVLTCLFNDILMNIRFDGEVRYNSHLDDTLSNPSGINYVDDEDASSLDIYDEYDYSQSVQISMDQNSCPLLYSSEWLAQQPQTDLGNVIVLDEYYSDDRIAVPIMLGETVTDQNGKSGDLIIMEISSYNGASREELLDFAGRLSFEPIGTLNNFEWR